MDYRTLRQTEAVDAAFSNNLCCTILCTVGFGKTITFYRILFRALEEGYITKDSRILMFTYTEALYSTYKEEALLYKELFGKNPLEVFVNIKMKCYASKILTKEKFNLVWADEVDMVGPVLAQQFIDHDGYAILMSGTLSDTQMITDHSSKREFILRYAPLAYEYTTEQGIKEGILINYQTYIINHNPSREIEGYKPFKKSYPTSEYGYIEAIKSYIDKLRFDEDIPADRKMFLIQRFGNRLSKFLQTLRSKEEKIKRLVNFLERRGDKVIVFARETKILDNILGEERVAYGQRNNIDELKEKFNSGSIQTLGFSYSLKRGFTPKTTTKDGVSPRLSLIMVHPVGNYEELKQILGRTIRTEKFNPDKVASIYIFKTVGSYEENWLIRSQYKRRKNGSIAGVLDLNIVKHISSNIL